MQWLNSLVNEYDANPLQKSGMLSREQVMQFFARSSAQFNNPQFKDLLRVGYEKKQNPQDLINSMQRQVFESLGVQGDFGINCLSKIRMVFGNDGELLRAFYEFVQSEEQLLDEVELPAEVYASKYAQISKFKEAIEEKAKDMSPEEQQRFVADMVKNMILQNGGQMPCCANGTCQNHAVVQKGPTTTAPNADAAGPTAPVMTEQEQLAFFQSLGKPQ